MNNHPRRKKMALALDISIVNPCASSNLENAARDAGKPLADAVKRNKNKCRDSFPATCLPLPIALSTCGEVCSNVHALTKAFVIRLVEHRSEIYSNESRYLMKGPDYVVMCNSINTHTHTEINASGIE